MSAPGTSDRRRFRAAVAARLLALAPDTAAVADWSDLDGAPAWMALPDADFALLQRRIGALIHAGDIRLWIDKARLSAARSALGDAFLHALLAQRDLDTLARQGATAEKIQNADQVRPLLQAAGSVVLLASLPNGALRRSLAAALDPTSAAGALNAELAQSWIVRAVTLAMQSNAAPSAPSTLAAGRPQ